MKHSTRAYCVFNFVAQDSSLTAINATMALTGTNIWPMNSTMQDELTQALMATMPVTPINIRILNTELQPNTSRRRRQLLQVTIPCFDDFLLPLQIVCAFQAIAQVCSSSQHVFALHSTTEAMAPAEGILFWMLT